MYFTDPTSSGVPELCLLSLMASIDALETLNKGQFGTALFLYGVCLLWEVEMDRHYMMELFWDLKLCPL
jgi:hypothetical protein